MKVLLMNEAFQTYVNEEYSRSVENGTNSHQSGRKSIHMYHFWY